MSGSRRLSGDRLNRIAHWMQGYVDGRRFPGASVLIHHGGAEAYYHEVGSREVAEGLPWTRDTLARIYSMTKPVTSVAIMMLAEEGRFHLDAPVSDFLSEFAAPHALIPGAERLDQVEPVAAPTLHQLLTHCSGLTYSFNPNLLSREMGARELDFEPAHGTLAEQIVRLAELPLAFAPGRRWEYGVGIDVLGRVVEVVSGLSLEAFFAERITGPLDMGETVFRVPKAAGDRFASLYTPLAGNAMDLNAAEKSSDPLRRVDHRDSSPWHRTTCFSGGGGLLGTIDDYMRFAEMLRQGGRLGDTRLLSPQTTDFMMRNHLPGDIASMGPASFAEQPMDGMGFGLGGAVVLDPARTRTPGSVGDFSWGGMASTFFWIDREQALSVVFLTQLSPSSSYPARPELKALVQGALI